MTVFKEKITQSFVFFKISAIAFAAHCQSAQAKIRTKDDKRSVILTHSLRQNLLYQIINI